ncbi:MULTISPECIES: DUF4397 domain-containing protein [unclassified Rubrivivax]|uniref:DUF4397 domain-containing protein n=1 Tax=unclassified Rubrivivax TaxID=2649762 RepID=UPI001E652BEC|nr:MULTISPECIES: DUF4397 domain-containing protein [unclassified Rubrivivax]MCC9596765.1 DUF4397 domain-containing protein [Rubrivivax sp. JA1055]MCC9648922.1 DUF4397 domain-containing protein [Rubrivivax sp. JA1029]
MQQINRRRWLTLALSSPVAFAGCGGGTDTSKAHVRFINASSYDALTLTVDDERLFSGIAWGDETSYRDVDPDDCRSTISRTGSATALVSSFTPSLSEDDDYTLLAWGPVGALGWQLLHENTSEPKSDKTKVRVFNGATDAGVLDVYVTAEDDELADSVAMQSSAAVGTLAEFVTIDAGTWRVRVTAAGSKTDVRLDVSSVVFPGGKVFTLALAAAAGGALVNGVLLREHKTTLTRIDATQARVRVAGAAAGSATVTATVEGRELVSAGSPVVSGYALVAAGVPAVTARIGSTDVSAAVPTATLAAGRDYTLLIYGSAASPASAWLVDDNTLSTGSSKARIRLVNAVAGLGSTLSLKSGSSQLASGVEVGAGSAYAEVSATASGSLTVTSPVVDGPVLALTDLILEGGKVYTVLVGGTPAAPIGDLVEDH